VAEVSARTGVSQHGSCKWIKRFAVPAPARQAQMSRTEKSRRPKAERERVAQERSILEKAVACFAKQSRRSMRSWSGTSRNAVRGRCAEEVQIHPSGHYAWKAQLQSLRARDDRRSAGLPEQTLR
jgi:hypothetical protein